jgi:hypothetical protein
VVCHFFGAHMHVSLTKQQGQAAHNTTSTHNPHTMQGGFFGKLVCGRM